MFVWKWLLIRRLGRRWVGDTGDTRDVRLVGAGSWSCQARDFLEPCRVPCSGVFRSGYVV